MKEALKKVNKRTSVGVAAFLISASYLASRVLGLLRDRLLASQYGIGPELDAYVAAFRIPELLFTLLVSGAFAVAFIPVLTSHLVKEEREEAWKVASSLLNLLILITLAGAVIVFVFADPLTRLVAPGFDAYRHDLTVNLTRIMLITPFFFSISSVLGSIQQSFNRFFFYALASVFYNVGIIAGIIALSPRYGVYGAAIGVVAGTVVQAAVQVLGLLGLGFRYRFSLKLHHPSVRKVLTLMVPRSIGQGIDQLNFTISTIIGSTLSPGSLTAFNFAHNLKNVPIGIFASAIATAAFPKLAAGVVRKQPEKVIRDLVVNSRMILFLVLPSAVLAWVMRGYIVRLLYGFGNQTTADVLGWFALAIIFQSLFMLVARVFYAMEDTKTPLYASIIAIGINVTASLMLVGPFGVSGLAMAQSLTALLETVGLMVILKRRFGSIGGRQLLIGATKMMVATLVMGASVYVIISQFLPLYQFDEGFSILASKFIAVSLVAGVTYFGSCYLLKLKEAHMVIDKIKAAVLRPLNLI